MKEQRSTTKRTGRVKGQKSTARSKGRPRGELMLILDRPALAAAVSRSYEPGRGARAKAAARVGLSDDSLAKLEARKQAAISSMTLERIHALVRPEDLEQVYAAILPPEAREKRDAAFTWRDEHQWRIEQLGSQAPTAGLRSLEYQLAVYRARELPEYSVFYEFCKARGHSEVRIFFAVSRTVAPLLDHLESGHVERAGWELSDKEFRTFVAAGFARERILLDRPEDNRRAQDVVAKALDHKRTKLKVQKELARFTIDTLGR
jgi:hypothetical protein